MNGRLQLVSDHQVVSRSGCFRGMTSKECCALPCMPKLKSDMVIIVKLFLVELGRCEIVKTPLWQDMSLKWVRAAHTENVFVLPCALSLAGLSDFLSNQKMKREDIHSCLSSTLRYIIWLNSEGVGMKKILCFCLWILYESHEAKIMQLCKSQMLHQTPQPDLNAFGLEKTDVVTEWAATHPQSC